MYIQNVLYGDEVADRDVEDFIYDTVKYETIQKYTEYLIDSYITEKAKIPPINNAGSR